MPADTYDAIVVGAGMGGLSAAAFLARQGKKILVLEKHDKPGGYVTSFSRSGFFFNSSIAHVNEMGENQTITRFMDYWGGEIRARRLYFKLRYFIDDREYRLDAQNLESDLLQYFPDKKEELQKFFAIIDQMNREAMSGGPMKPPCEMGPVEKVSFIMNMLAKKPAMRRYGMKPAVRVLARLFNDPYLESMIWGFYPVNSLNFLSESWGWLMMQRGEYYYPEGGMQAIPDAVVKALERLDAKVLCNTEVLKILAKNGQAAGVECSGGQVYRAPVVIANAPVHHTVNKLGGHLPELDSLRAKVNKRKLFSAVGAVYAGLESTYDFDGCDYCIFLDRKTKDLPEEELTPRNCPILLMIQPQPAGQAGRSVIIGAILPYRYMNNWGTEATGQRGAEYRRLKQEMHDLLLERITAKLGPDFRRSLQYSVAATPLTFERYTYNAGGSIMGWHTSEYGKFLPFETAVKNLYLVGHWVFPGGGVPAVMGSGYFVARKILRREGIDLEQRLETYFQQAKGEPASSELD